MQLDHINESWSFNVPLVICGDFNSIPSDSLIHLLYNKQFTLSEASGRADPKTGIKAYRQSQGIDLLKKVQFDI